MYVRKGVTWVPSESSLVRLVVLTDSRIRPYSLNAAHMDFCH